MRCGRLMQFCHVLVAAEMFGNVDTSTIVVKRGCKR